MNSQANFCLRDSRCVSSLGPVFFRPVPVLFFPKISFWARSKAPKLEEHLRKKEVHLCRSTRLRSRVIYLFFVRSIEIGTTIQIGFPISSHAVCLPTTRSVSVVLRKTHVVCSSCAGVVKSGRGHMSERLISHSIIIPERSYFSCTANFSLSDWKPRPG